MPDAAGEGWLLDARDWVLLQVRRLGRKIRPWPLLLVLHVVGDGVKKSQNREFLVVQPEPKTENG